MKFSSKYLILSIVQIAGLTVMFTTALMSLKDFWDTTLFLFGFIIAILPTFELQYMLQAIIDLSLKYPTIEHILDNLDEYHRKFLTEEIAKKLEEIGEEIEVKLIEDDLEKIDKEIKEEEEKNHV